MNTSVILVNSKYLYYIGIGRGVVVMGWWLGWMILVVFSNLNDCVIQPYDSVITRSYISYI